MAQKRCALDGVANDREFPSDVCGSNNQILLLGGGCQHGRHHCAEKKFEQNVRQRMSFYRFSSYLWYWNVSCLDRLRY